MVFIERALFQLPFLPALVCLRLGVFYLMPFKKRRNEFNRIAAKRRPVQSGVVGPQFRIVPRVALRLRVGLRRVIRYHGLNKV